MHKADDCRQWYMDVLRIAAIIAVVMLHTSPQAHLEVEVTSAAWKAMNAVTSLGTWAVPVFFMISGALNLDANRAFSLGKLYKKTILRMALSFIAWSSFYALAYCVTYGKGKWTFLTHLIRGHYHMWFIFAIAALYWITPALRRIASERRTTEYLLAAGFVMLFLLPRTLSFILLFDVPHADVFEALQSAVSQLNPYKGLTSVFYYLLGHYLHTYPVSKRAVRVFAPAAAAGVIGTFVLTGWHSAALGTTSSYFTGHGALTTLAAASGIFVCVKAAMEGYTPSARAQRTLRELAASSFGVYLAHAFVLEQLGITYATSAPLLLAQIAGVTAAAAAASCAVSMILRRIPLIGRYII